MIHEQAWFEMTDKRKPRLNTASWVPIYARHIASERDYPELGHWEEYFGAAALLFPAESHQDAMQVEWSDASHYSNRPQIDANGYSPSRRFIDWRSGLEGEHTVLRNFFDTVDGDQILIEPELLVALRLCLEGNVWISPREDYSPIIRVNQDDQGRTVLIEIRSEQLKDYLCARNCGLLVSTFRSRREICADPPGFSLTNDWEDNGASWQGGITEVSSTGGQYGSEVSILTTGRDDVDPDDDVPLVGNPPPGTGWMSKQRYQRLGEKRFRIVGEMWRNEWIEPGKQSFRVRGDRRASTIEFIVDNDGSRLRAPDLIGPQSRWLWFAPTVIVELLSHRNTELIWHTENTGGMSIPGEGVVHFGVNSEGLVNVYAKDIGELKELWHKVWAPFNVVPDGKVCRELLAAQMESRPADTNAPESLLEDALAELDVSFEGKFGGKLYRDHAAQDAIWRDVHRFAAATETGFFRLMKDLTRLCVERLDIELLKKLTPSANKQLGSIKRMERILDECGANGKGLAGPLVGIYELRHVDSHLPPSDLDDAFRLLGVQAGPNFLQKGKTAIRTVADCLQNIANAITPKQNTQG